MKTRFNSIDIVCAVTELEKLIGLRVNNVYDIDNKTYLIKLQQGEDKAVLLMESGNRIHTTNFEWPKNIAPSGFSMKLRKHLKNKRLEVLRQIGSDRIIDMQFGTGEAAYHVILELYDRGNIILTDYEWLILNVLRPHTEGDRIKFVVREKYPQDRARISAVPTLDELRKILEGAKVGDPLKKVLVPHLDYGPALIEHILLKHKFTNASKIGKTFNIENDLQELFLAIQDGEAILGTARKQHSKGYIIQKKEERPSTDPNSEKEHFYSNQEFHPFLFGQHESLPHREFESFNSAVDEFYSTAEGQKIEMRALQQERDALKKLDNIRKDHDQRLLTLEKTQDADRQKAEMITRNQELVDKAILAVQSALANQVSWEDLKTLVKDAAANGDPVAQRIKELKLQTNHISLYLTDPFEGDSDEYDESEGYDKIKDFEELQPAVIDVDLALTAFANATRYYNQKRNAAKKQQKTIESQGKALKSAEKKTKQTLKDVQTITNINKARKVYWFEKFFWFISSENYLVIAGRDQQQNELVVKRYMRPTDIYVHADVHGASSVIIKNPSGQPVPPKTLNEAGTMAICYSVAWDAKVVTNAYWVTGDQVSKTAPTGEYLTTGSFMVRGKKNFLPPAHLILGFSFLFRLEDSFVAHHMNERKVITGTNSEDTKSEVAEDEDIEINDDSDEGNDAIKEETEDEVKDEAEDNDTHIRIEHTEGTRINIITKSVSIEHNEENVIPNGKPSAKNKESKDEGKQKQAKETQNETEKKELAKSGQFKRGQKSKLKKMKEKYKDQDEEERQLRMEILQSAGTGKETKKSKKRKDAQVKSEKKINAAPKAAKPQLLNDENEDEEDKPIVQADVDMIDSLTGQPNAEDELLFAVPVVAPYSTLTNYKFKVKLTPGTNRRGKAARTAVSMFIRDRASTQREKDLLRAVKDELLARNLPGKVKMSAPRMQVLRK